MKLKKLFSLSLAAAMLLSTAALPVAAGVTEGETAVATSSITPYFEDFSNYSGSHNGDDYSLQSLVSKTKTETTTVVGKRESKTVELPENVSARKNYGTSEVITTNAGASDYANLYVNLNEERSVAQGFSIYSDGTNIVSVDIKGTDWNEKALGGAISINGKKLSAHNESITEDLAVGWHDYTVASDFDNHKVYYYMDGKLIKSEDNTTFTKYNYANYCVSKGTNENSVAFDDVYWYGKQTNVTPEGDTTMSSSATTYEVNMGQKVFLPKDSTLTNIADAVKIYKVEGSTETELTEIAKSWDNDTWKDVVTLSDLSLESDSTYKVKIDGVTDAFGTAITDVVTFTTETTYAVTLKANEAEGGTVTLVDEEGNDLEKTTGKYAAGAKVYAKATPKEGYYFTGWNATGVTLQSGDKSCKTPDGRMLNPITITVPDTAVTLEATFSGEQSAYYNDGSSKSTGFNNASSNDQVSIVDATTIAGNSDDITHGKVLQVKYTGTESNAYINANVKNARNAVTGYSFWMPADSADSTKVSTSYSIGVVSAKGVSGSWADDQIKAANMIGVENGVLYYNRDKSMGTGYEKVSWKNDDGTSKLTPGWHAVMLAFDVDKKQISYYIDNTYLGTATYSNMTTVAYLAHSHATNDVAYYYDDFLLYYPEDAAEPQGDEIVTYGTTEYTIDMGQKVTFEGTTVPVTVTRGTQTIAATAELVKGTTKDSVKLTFADGLTDGTYVVKFGTMTDLLGKAFEDIDFDVMPEDAKLVSVKFTAGEGGQIKTTVGEKVVTAASNTMVLAAGTEITIEAVPNEGYVMDSAWTGLNDDMLKNVPADGGGDNNGKDHRPCWPKLNIIVPESDAAIGVSFYKLTNPAPQFHALTTSDSVTAFKKLTGNSGNVQYDSDGTNAKVTNTYNLSIDTNKNLVFGFSVKKTTGATSYKLAVRAKSDKPCDRWLSGDPYASATFLQFADDKIKLTDEWTDVSVAMDFKNHKIITWVNGAKKPEYTTPETFEWMTRFLMTGSGYSMKDFYFYYPDETSMNASTEVETHTTEYVIEMGQKVFLKDNVDSVQGAVDVVQNNAGSVSDGLTKGTDYTVTKESDEYSDKIKVTFTDDTVLKANTTYTVNLSGLVDAYGNSFTESKTFSVKAKKVKVTAEVGNKRMGQVALKQGNAAATSGDSFEEGTVLNATATPATNYEFVKWEATGIDLTDEQKANATLAITTPWQNNVTVKAIFKRTTDTAIAPFRYGFENWDGTKASPTINGISFYATKDRSEKVWRDDAHGYAYKQTDADNLSILTENKDNAVFGVSFNTSGTASFRIDIPDEDTETDFSGNKWNGGNNWNSNHIKGILTVNAPKGGKQTVSVKGGQTFELTEGWHDLVFALDFRHSELHIWLDGKYQATTSITVKQMTRFMFNGVTGIGLMVDDLFMYKQGGNAVETTVNVKAGTDSWTFDVGEMLYNVTAEVSVEGATTSIYQPEIKHVDKYNYNMSFTGGETWEDRKAYTVEITGTDAFGNKVTKTITANATTMYTATVKAEPETMGSVSIVDKKDAYAQGEKFTVQATIKDTDKYSFKGWSVTGSSANIESDASDKTKATVLVGNGDVTVTAKFQEIPKSDVTVTTDDAAKGSVDAATWNATDEKWGGAITNLKPGTQVRVKANPTTGYKFKEWEVNGVTLTETQETQNALVFDMGETAVSIKAVFEAYEGSQPANTLPFYWDFETAKANGYGTQSGFFINNTGWNDNSATIYTTTAYTDEEHGRSLVMGPEGNTHFVSIAAPCETGKNIVFGYEALVDSTAGSSFGFSSKQSSGQWTGLFNACGKTVTTSQVYKNEEGKLKNRDSKSGTVTDGWHKFAFAFDLANDTIYVYIDGTLFDTVTEEYDLVEQIGFSLTNFCWNTAFDNMFAYYPGDAVKLTGEDNVKHTITSYEIAADQLIYQSPLGYSVNLKLQDGISDPVEADVTLTNDKTTSKLALTFTADAKLKEDTTYKIDFSESIGEGVWTDMIGRELPDYTFKTRSTKPTITVKDATTYEGTLPQDTVTDIEVTALNIANNETLTVYQNGTAVKTLTVSGVTEDDMSYKATIEVTLQGGDNKFEVVWGDTKGDTTIEARKFSTLSTVMDVDFESDITNATFGTKSAPEGTLTVIDGDADHGKVYEVDYPTTAGGGGSPFFISPGAAKATSGIVVTEADFYFVGDTYHVGIFNIKDNSNKWISQYGVKNGKVTSFGTEVATVQSNTWYRMKHLIDIDNGMIYYFIDGRLIDAHAYQANDSGTWKDADGFQYWNQQASAKGTTFLVDNIKMYRYAETADFTVTGYGGTERVDVNGTICVNFTQTMDADTLENITVTDESGNVVSKLTEWLEDDGKTYAITVNGLNYNAPYTVTVPATVKTTSGASNAEAKATIWTEKADFSIDTATVTAGSGGNIKVTVNLNSAGTETGYVLVYAYEGTKLVGVNYATVKNGAVQYSAAGAEYISLNVPLSSTNLTYGVTLVDSLSSLKTIDFMWITD